MKQLPRIAGQLYCHPWLILPAEHAELGRLYRGYITGTLAVPDALSESGSMGCGISHEADHASGIVVIDCCGIVCKHDPQMMCGPRTVALSELDQLLAEVANDPALHTVVLYFNSPGGSVIGLQETAANIRDLAATKRLVAYTDYQCCSAAYYLAAACDEIYAAPSAFVGSIGTYMAALDDSRAWEMDGVELKLFKVGSLKAIGHPGKKWTPEEEKFLQDLTDQVGAEFHDWVVSRRPGIEESSLQGQWFSAGNAPRGMVDGLYRDMTGLLADLMSAGPV